MNRETMVQATIMHYLGFLEQQGLGYFFRNNSFSGKLTRWDGSQGVIKNGKRGTPDICGVYKAKFIGIEVKVGKGKQSEWQVEAQKRIESAGGVYLLVHDADEVKDALNGL